MSKTRFGFGGNETPRPESPAADPADRTPPAPSASPAPPGDSRRPGGTMIGHQPHLPTEVAQRPSVPTQTDIGSASTFEAPAMSRDDALAYLERERQRLSRPPPTEAGPSQPPSPADVAPSTLAPGQPAHDPGERTPAPSHTGKSGYPAVARMGRVDSDGDLVPLSSPDLGDSLAIPRERGRVRAVIALVVVAAAAFVGVGMLSRMNARRAAGETVTAPAAAEPPPPTAPASAVAPVPAPPPAAASSPLPAAPAAAPVPAAPAPARRKARPARRNADPGIVDPDAPLPLSL